MKRTKQIVTAALTAMFISVMLAIPAFALEGHAGDKVTLNIPYSATNSVSGSISYSNAALFSNVEASVSGGLSGVVTPATVAVYGTELSSGNIVLTCTISSSAKSGDSCTVTLAATVGDENFNESAYSKSVTVSVKEKEQTPPTVAPPAVKPGNTQPTQPTVDHSALESTITGAKMLSQAEYTAESWASFSNALSDAQEKQNSSKQEVVDSANASLQGAMDQLVKMNYQPLQNAIAEAKTVFADNETADCYAQLYAALEEAEGLLSSGDQAAADSGAQKLGDLLAALEEDGALLEEQKKTDSGKNIVLTASLALNAAFAVLVAFYYIRRYRNHRDTTPLVDYDISDDEQ